MNQKKTLHINKKIIIFLFINTFFLAHGGTLKSFLEKTHNKIGYKAQTIIGPFVLYYGFYKLWEEWKKMINRSNMGDDAKNILTLGLKGPKNALNYAIPFAAIILMPRVNIENGFHLYSNLFKTVVNTLNTTKP